MMRPTNCVAVLSACAALALAPSAFADFAGQPILGTLSLGGSATGNTTGHGDENDGFDSGFHFFDVWTGGDDVYKINWLGGDMMVTLTNISPVGDNDLFIYRPTDLDSSGDYSTLGSADVDVVTILNAPAGTYYINIDSTDTSEGGYQVAVVPAPASAALLGLGALAFGRRRRA